MNERIKQLRKLLKLTQTEFGEKIGVKGNTITNYETCLREPSNAVIVSICREFNVNEHWLRTGEGEMFVRRSTTDELSALLGDFLSEEPSFKHRLISVLLRMSPDEWALVEKKAKELVDDKPDDASCDQ